MHDLNSPLRRYAVWYASLLVAKKWFWIDSRKRPQLSGMKVHVHKRSGKFIATLQVDEDLTVEAFKDLYYSQRGLFSSLWPFIWLADHYYPERQRFTVKDREWL